MSEALNDTFDESINVHIFDLDDQRNNECLQTTSTMPSSDNNNDWQVLCTLIAQADSFVSKLECLITEGKLLEIIYFTDIFMIQLKFFTTLVINIIWM